eukprot:32275-Eustigmatos_ZCMA.PRE.1
MRPSEFFKEVTKLGITPKCVPIWYCVPPLGGVGRYADVVEAGVSEAGVAYAGVGRYAGVAEAGV